MDEKQLDQFFTAAINRHFIVKEKWRFIDIGNNVRMSFGRFEGQLLRDVPLSYLDKTVSNMPDCWLVRRAREYVDLVDLRFGPYVVQAHFSRSVSELQVMEERGEFDGVR